MVTKETPQQRDYSEILNDLETLSESLAQYLEATVEILNDYETPEYQRSPQLVDFLGKTNEEDIMQIEFLFEEVEDKEKLQQLLSELRNFLKTNRPVTFYLLQELFEPEEEEEEEEEEKPKQAEDPNKIPKFTMQNLLFDSFTEYKKFMIDCGLRHEPGRGKGGHERFFTKEGEQAGGYSKNSKIWYKNHIKDLLKVGVPAEDIKAGCRKNRIEIKFK